jgi:hypothetical protein
MTGCRGHLCDGEEIVIETDERNSDENRRVRIHQDDHISRRRYPTCKSMCFISEVNYSFLLTNSLAFR